MNHTHLKHLFTACLLVAATNACTWVEPDVSAGQVSVIAAGNTPANCQRLGVTSSLVRDRVGIFSRSDERVAEELLTLAKNAAVEMGGNSIQPVTEVVDGEQKFGIFLCR